MCGIVGAVSSRNIVPILIEGLKRLEYRGYDSAGLALLEDGGLDYIREGGNLQKLKLKAGKHRSAATTGVGHTRWATHGRVSLENALFEGRHWLPYRQEIAIRRQAAWLDFPFETGGPNNADYLL